MKSKRLKITAIVLIVAMLLSLPAAAATIPAAPNVGILNLLGDINGDGKVDIFDCLEILKNIIKMPPKDAKRDPGKTHPQVAALNVYINTHVKTHVCPKTGEDKCPTPNACHNDKDDCVANRCPNIETSCHRYPKELCDELWASIEFDNECPFAKEDCLHSRAEMLKYSDMYTDAFAELTAAKAIIALMLCQDCGGPYDEVAEHLQEQLDQAENEIQRLEDEIADHTCEVRDCEREHCETGKCRIPCELAHCTPACDVSNTNSYKGEPFAYSNLPVDPEPLPDGQSRPTLDRVTTINMNASTRDNSHTGTGRARFEDKNGNAVGSTGAGTVYRLRIRRGGHFIIGGQWTTGGQIYIDARQPNEDAHAGTDWDINYLICNCPGATKTNPGCARPTKPQLQAPGYNGHWVEIDDPDPFETGTIIVPARYRVHEPVTIYFRNLANMAMFPVALTSNEHGPAIFDRRSSEVKIVLVDGSNTTISDTAGVVYPPVIREPDEDASPGSNPNIEPNGTVYIRSDLTITGHGNLTVNGNYRHGLVSRDNITINGGSIRINTDRGSIINIPVYNKDTGEYEPAEEDTDTSEAGNAIHGRDSVTINAGEFMINAGNAGIRSDNIMNTRKSSNNRFNKEFDSGFIYIKSGRFHYIHAPNGSAIRSAVPEYTKGSSFTAGPGGGTKIENRVIFDFILERKGRDPEEEDPDLPDPE
ncbi:MAG: carbohydrate-binding domain-containing protein [Oscillospiraceae bacterium]|nr:carbohydrate-binding domain-containing protein [Oscillospiraceae bacterium]